MRCKDITGLEIHNIKVLYPTERPPNLKSGAVWWRCLCYCGKEFSASGNAIRFSSHKTCGCDKQKRDSGSKNGNWKGLGELSASHWRYVINGAKSRELSLNITMQYAWDLFLKQNRKCALSNLDLYFGPSSRKASQGNASLDRIDSSLGYEINNVQWVEKRIQLMKMNLPEKDFIFLCGRVFLSQQGELNADNI